MGVLEQHYEPSTKQGTRYQIKEPAGSFEPGQVDLSASFGADEVRRQAIPPKRRRTRAVLPGFNQPGLPTPQSPEIPDA